MFVIKYKWIFFLISGVLLAGSIYLLSVYGLKLGTDFTGGTILELAYRAERPAPETLRTALEPFELGAISIQPAGEHDLIIRSRSLTLEEKDTLTPALDGGGRYPFTEKRFNSIGPAVGQELASKARIALSLVVVLIILFITLAFRKVSRPVSSWKYGVVAFIALLHDVIIPTGVFAWLGHYYGVEIDALFLTGLLTILGLSIHDTIVVFDRIRENLRHRTGTDFAVTVGQSLSETFTRSINTSMTIILVLVIIFFYGAESTKYFSLLMAIGVLVGTYSSIFIASPLLVVWERWTRR